MLPVKQLGERFIEIWRKRTDAEAVSDEQVLMLEQPERILKIRTQDFSDAIGAIRELCDGRKGVRWTGYPGKASRDRQIGMAMWIAESL